MVVVAAELVIDRERDQFLSPSTPVSDRSIPARAWWIGAPSGNAHSPKRRHLGVQRMFSSTTSLVGYQSESSRAIDERGVHPAGSVDHIVEPAGWSRPSSIGMRPPAGSARPKQSPNRRPRWARMYTFRAVVPSTEPTSRPGPTGGEGCRQQAVHRCFGRSPMGECVSGLLQPPQAHKGTDKVGWQDRGGH